MQLVIKMPFLELRDLHQKNNGWIEGDTKMEVISGTGRSNHRKAIRVNRVEIWSQDIDYSNDL